MYSNQHPKLYYIYHHYYYHHHSPPKYHNHCCNCVNHHHNLFVIYFLLSCSFWLLLLFNNSILVMTVVSVTSKNSSIEFFYLSFPDTIASFVVFFCVHCYYFFVIFVPDASKFPLCTPVICCFKMYISFPSCFLVLFDCDIFAWVIHVCALIT